MSPVSDFAGRRARPVVWTFSITRTRAARRTPPHGAAQRAEPGPNCRAATGVAGYRSNESATRGAPRCAVERPRRHSLTWGRGAGWIAVSRWRIILRKSGRGYRDEADGESGQQGKSWSW